MYVYIYILFLLDVVGVCTPSIVLCLSLQECTVNGQSPTLYTSTFTLFCHFVMQLPYSLFIETIFRKTLNPSQLHSVPPHPNLPLFFSLSR